MTTRLKLFEISLWFHVIFCFQIHLFEASKHGTYLFLVVPLRCISLEWDPKAVMLRLAGFYLNICGPDWVRSRLFVTDYVDRFSWLFLTTASIFRVPIFNWSLWWEHKWCIFMRSGLWSRVILALIGLLSIIRCWFISGHIIIYKNKLKNGKLLSFR
jgi:hypothetical protein